MNLQHPETVTEARKVLADTEPPQWTREQLRDRLAEVLWKWRSGNTPWSRVMSHPDFRYDLEDYRQRADSVVNIVWPLIEQQAADNARQRASLEAVLAYTDELLAIVNEQVKPS